MKSYKVKYEQIEFPRIEMPLNEQELAWVAKACNLHIQERFVPKSARMEQLAHELELASALQETAMSLKNSWAKNVVMPKIRFEEGNYKFWEQDWAYFVKSNLEDAGERVKNYDKRIRSAQDVIIQTLNTAVSELKHSLEIEEKGISGEDRVERYLVSNLNARILSGVVLPGVQVQDSDPKTAETDLLVFTQSGIYVCEVKNYGKAGQTLQVRDDGHILKTDRNGTVLEDMGSPFAQNDRHCASVAQVLSNAGLSFVPIYSAVIIANTDVNISKSTRHWIGDMYEFQAMVTAANNAQARLTQEQMDGAYAAVKDSRLTERKFPIPAVSPVAEDLQIAFAHITKAMNEHTLWAKETESAVADWNRQQFLMWRKVHWKECEYEHFMKVHHTACCLIWLFLVLSPLVLGAISFFVEMPPGTGMVPVIFCIISAISGLLVHLDIDYSFEPRTLKPRTAFTTALLLLPRAVVVALLPTAVILVACYFPIT